jgi:hypothetical protein
MSVSGRRVVGLVITFVVGFLLLFMVYVGVSSAQRLGYEPATYAATKTGAHSASLSLAIFPDSMVCHGSGGGLHPTWVTYCPSTSISVPANSVITVTLTQYDGGDPLHNPFFAHVQGTVGGVEWVNGKKVRYLNPNDAVAHTFTLQSAPDSPEPMFVNVPMAALPDDAKNAVTVNGNQYPKPNIIRFKFRTGKAGHYVFHCYDPCGTGLEGNNDNFGGPMATTGYMAGTVTVTNS